MQFNANVNECEWMDMKKNKRESTGLTANDWELMWMNVNENAWERMKE